MSLPYYNNFNYLNYLLSYYLFLLKISNLFFINKFLYKNLYKTFAILNWTKTYFYKNNYFKKIHPSYDVLKIEKKCHFSDELFENSSESSVCFKKNSSNEFFLLKNFFFFNFLFGFSSFFSFFDYQREYSFFYLKNLKKNLIVADIPKFINRWKNAQNFIFNIYYYNFTPILFGSFEFQNEILALNWNNINMEYNYWKYTFSFFTRAVNNYGVRTKHFFKKIENLNVDFF